MSEKDFLSNNSVSVFLGPSLPREKARKVLAARFLPPIQRGDLAKAVQQGARAVGIIDGSFYRCRSVSPFEILTALRQGIKVYGASSMGALKALECEPFGMVGVGKIFQWFQTGRIDAEDEVAIVFNPDSLHALSDPLVNMRYAFGLAEKEGVIGRQDKNRLLRMAKKIYFPERTYKKVFSLAMQSKKMSSREIEQLKIFVKKDSCDLKALDALECLSRIRNELA